MFALYAYNMLLRKENSKSSGFFLKKFLGSNPSTVEDLQKRIEKGDTSFISKIQHFSSKIRGSPSWWRLQRQNLTTWMNYHAQEGHGPPTFFITLSCAENHWGNLADILADRIACNNLEMSEKLKSRDYTAMAQAARDHPLLVAKFFQKRVETWLETVGRTVFKIKHHWGAYEFAKGRGVIHIHMLAIADNMNIMREYYNLRNDKEEQVKYIADYARNQLFMTAEHPAGSAKNNIAAPEGNANKKDFMKSVQESFSECKYAKQDLINCVNGCSMHWCNDYCLRHSKFDKKKTT